MDLEYVRKFEEMKKYIPFLESMINRLELEGTRAASSNPRQAQLDKIRSLRDLLQDKKKRLKMENLLKCEQVLINLYAKVEQRDTLPGIKKTSDPLFQSSTATEKPELDICRSKLKIVSSKSKLQNDDPDTLPEIARPSETEVVCTPGSKEPALFQRRPNKASISPLQEATPKNCDSKSPSKPVPKRNYTRVLVSPEPSPRRWSPSEDLSTDKVLYSRRSPSHKKEKKKSSKQKKSQCTDLSITLNVPEDSLNSLNRRDILSRIIECPDDDMDIKTLCDVKAQILRELRQSGSSEDISDLILNSYKVKTKSSKKKEIEEGELSDSESEAIESIYGSLLIVDKEKTDSEENRKLGNKDKQQRKVQIRLVLNSNKSETLTSKNKEETNFIEISDFEMFDDGKTKTQHDKEKDTVESKPENKSSDVITIDDEDEKAVKSVTNNVIEPMVKDVSSNLKNSDESPDDNSSEKGSSFKANFYKPLNSQEESSKTSAVESHKIDLHSIDSNQKKLSETPDLKDKTQISKNKTVDFELKTNEIDQYQIPDKEIPLLNTATNIPAPPAKSEETVSEIDILQALKNEILSESIAIPGTEVATPLLHQPKLTKVASAQEITKKRISIDKYKNKSLSAHKSPLFYKQPNISKTNDNFKKQSLKLTEAECERFNFPTKLSLEDSSDDEVTDLSVVDIYGDLDEDFAPKSPENIDRASTESSAPIIIPVDPVKPTTACSNKSDVDMRTMMPILSPNAPKPVPSPSPTLTSIYNVGKDLRNEQSLETKRPALIDPRMKREMNKPLPRGSPSNSLVSNPEGTPRAFGHFPNMTPNMTPLMTPNSRSFEMTPSRPSFDSDDSSIRKHVYAPVPTFESRDCREQSVNRDDCGPRWEPNVDTVLEERTPRWDTWNDNDLRDRGPTNKWDDFDSNSRGSQNDRYNREQRDDYSYGRLDCPRTPVHPFGRVDCPSTPSHPFGRSECPTTPSHPFGRSDCPPNTNHQMGRSEHPMTPSHPFGRSEAPMTPGHSFGRSEGPNTPSHLFGRSDAPMTPIHPFGRSEAPRTPSHPFGRNESGMAPRTPSHPFGHSDYSQSSHQLGPKDPRLNRSTDYDSGSRKYESERDRAYYKDRRRHDMSNRPYSNSDKYRGYDRDYGDGRNDRNRYEQINMSRHNESDSLYTRERGTVRSNYNQRDHENTRNYGSLDSRQDCRRAISVGRSGPAEDRFQRSSSRGPSAGRTLQDTCNTLSVKPQSGRSFTIDTSVNTTFQEFLTGKGLQILQQNSFDSRRGRAQSVGRTRESSVGRHFRENSVGRSLSKPPRLVQEDTSGYKKMVNFVRARSVGRDVIGNTGKSFKDVKAYFERFKVNDNQKELHLIKNDKPNRDPQKTKNIDLPQHHKGSTFKQTYSPRKNYRDPRMRKESYYDNRNKYKYEDKRKSYGIVYSTDNIAKGTILGPGYGVKNYKIPKIKRPVAEKEDNVEPVSNKVEAVSNKVELVNNKTDVQKEVKSASANDKKAKLRDDKSMTDAEKNKVDVQKEVKSDIATEKKIKVKDDKSTDAENKYKIDERKDKHTEHEPKKAQFKKIEKNKKSMNIEEINPKPAFEINKRTRSRKSEIDRLKEDQAIVFKPKRSNKAVIDSDSENETDTKQIDSNKTVVKDKKVEADNVLDSSFGIDDLGIFPENMASDPDINALIANLGNDIDTTKADAIDFTKDLQEISFDTMINKIEGPEINKQLTVGESLDDISELIKDDLKNTDLRKHEVSTMEKQCSENEINETQPNVLMHDKQVAVEIKTSGILKDNTELLTSENQTQKQSVPENAHNSEKTPINLVNCTKESLHDNTMQEKITEVETHQIFDKESTFNDAIVSTTELEKDPQKIFDELSEDRCSTPDSTININEGPCNRSIDEQGLPDSTNEKNEMNPAVTSTLHDQPETSVNKDCAPSLKDTAPLDSIGNLISILKDKSKIQELLCMLGNQSSENDKIKKTLEKISAIVSDEDDKTDETKTGEEHTSIEKVVEKDVSDDNNLLEHEATNTNKESYQSSEPNMLPETPFQPSVSKQLVKEFNQPCLKELDEESKSNLDNEDADKEHPSNKSTQRKLPIKKMRKGRKKLQKKSTSDGEKRVTRSGAANLTTEKPKKASRELKLLHESIKEMFLSDDILNASGIRMCRLAKLVGDKNSNPEEKTSSPTEPKPVVVLEKFKDKDMLPEASKLKKKQSPKKTPIAENVDDKKVENKMKDGKSIPALKPKPGPKSKTKMSQECSDPYSFEDSMSENLHSSEVHSSSDSDSDSLASIKSFGSTEALADLKKKTKRKRRFGWQSGFIKSNKKRKKTESKLVDTTPEDTVLIPRKEDSISVPHKEEVTIPDMNCFIDKTYCFQKNVFTYSCRLCIYSGIEIVKHYKTEHPHTEIPLSRMSEAVAREAIEQCEDINFQAISKMLTNKYECRFCFEKFLKKQKQNVLEEFFWHVVSMHTGEYKNMCSECINVKKCSFNLDIPPPPKNINGQLIGYICGKCNFTQISLENLKTHVIVRHNDEQTAVYTVNLAAMNKQTIVNLMKTCTVVDEKPRVLRSSRTNADLSEGSGKSDAVKSVDQVTDTDSVKNESIDVLPVPEKRLHSKLTFETDDVDSANTATGEVKKEREENQNMVSDEIAHHEVPNLEDIDSTPERHVSSNDILDYPHFKVSYSSTGTKEYVCCIMGNDNHYKTALLISMKKHVQIKHLEVWDGYCFLCKVIVMPQGTHRFKECLQHFLDNHMDGFPILEQAATDTENSLTEPSANKITNSSALSTQRSDSPQTYIHVRPLSDLLSTPIPEDNPRALPKIQSVMSLGAGLVSVRATPQPSPSLSPQHEPTPDNPAFRPPTPVVKPVQKPIETYKYEEVQAEIMAKKHRVILDTMLSHEKLVHIFKCSGAYCSYTTDSPEAAIIHASTHQRVGGENALICAYCDYDCKSNAIDLVMHIFKTHGRCQFVCGHCFYRAVAVSLVLAHINRVHGANDNKVILETATISPVTEDSAEELLPREVAVPQFVCIDLENQCKFKTYTQGKFMEHCSRHNAGYYLCNVCLAVSQTPVELTQHFKTHGYRLYQCTWCIDGGDTESEFLGHASAKHPTKLPQAYLRGYTNNNRALPLIKFTNAKTPILQITPIMKREDPAKVAENSLDLEKIITSMPQLAEASASDATPTNTTQMIKESASLVMTPSSVTEVSTSKSASEVSIPKPAAEVPMPEPVAKVPTPKPAAEVSTPNSEIEVLTPNQPLVESTPPPCPSRGEDISLCLTPVLKTEPAEETPTKDNKISEVICLDSDEDNTRDYIESRQNVIDVSDEESVQKNTPTKTTNILQVFKCYKCQISFKNSPGFKKHLLSCFNGIRKLNCAHCVFSTDNPTDLYLHYTCEHGGQSTKVTRNKGPFICAICNRKDKNILNIKSHIKKEHNLINLVVTSKVEQGERVHYINGVCPKPRPAPKRKLSSSNASECQPKRTRFGPLDLDKLPKKPILDELTYCSECEFSSKVRLNLVRHFQQHAEAQSVPLTAPVNPVPHLETNEKHFDKMINLASSSLETARSDKQDRVVLQVPPEAVSRYPKYVPDRQRHTCGAKDCSYISVDESMLKCHWETLHAGSNDFHCVHCPPYQHLDTSKPLTASRIITHLKMHDTCLYACSACSYYHYKKQILEKHLVEGHKGSGHVMVVREETSSQTVAPQSASAGPTMDLKPWKCGLCLFKSMLLPEVVDHCSKIHNTKMQYKCPVCPFRTSTLENVTKHQMNAHPGNKDDVFYYYYREGSIPDEPDGTPRWLKQQQKLGLSEPEVKTEVETCVKPALLTPILPNVETVNLDIVKKEVTETEDSMEELCEKFGAICDPNGLNFKCPLCKMVVEESKEAMQSHLYEELKYRKWGCKICWYKGFHKAGLNEHMITEHKQNRSTPLPVELPIDMRVEKWVAKVLEHQSSMIEANKANFEKQKIQVDKPKIVPPTVKNIEPSQKNDVSNEKTLENLKQAFGEFGMPRGMYFVCPKCDYQETDEGAMKDHLETELNKIRWRCSCCWKHAQTYHEAQLHCKVCTKPFTGVKQPVPTARDPSVRAAWLAEVINYQRRIMDKTPDALPETCTTSSTEDSLLVVRYEEDVPTPEEEMLNRRKRPAPAEVPPASPDSDDERLVIDEPSGETPKKSKGQCPHCDFNTKYQKTAKIHLLRHYNLKPYSCGYCDATFQRKKMENHFYHEHPGRPQRFTKTKLPSGPPVVYTLYNTGNAQKKPEDLLKDDAPRVVCLVCEKPVIEYEKESHTHDEPTHFAKKGAVVVKCCTCMALVPDVATFNKHTEQYHPNKPINYAFHRLLYDTRETLQCGHCNKGFKFIKDLRIHHNMLHSSLQLRYEARPFVPGSYDMEAGSEYNAKSSKSNDDDVILVTQATRRVARKSTTKLPSQAVARKSTTKLPYYSKYDNGTEYSYYGTKPIPLKKFENVTTLMPFCNTMMPFSVEKLSGIIKINPIVLVKDCKK